MTILASLDACHHGQHSNSNSCSLLCKTDQHYCVSQEQRRNEIPADLRRIRRFLPGANPTTWRHGTCLGCSFGVVRTSRKEPSQGFFSKSQKLWEIPTQCTKSCTSRFSCQILSDQHVTCQQPAKWTEHGLSMDWASGSWTRRPHVAEYPQRDIGHASPGSCPGAPYLPPLGWAWLGSQILVRLGSWSPSWTDCKIWVWK